MIRVRNRVYSKTYGYGTVVAYADEEHWGHSKFLVRFDDANSFLNKIEEDLKTIPKAKADMLDKEWLRNHSMIAMECDDILPPIGLFVIKCNGSGSIKFAMPYVPLLKGSSNDGDFWGLGFTQKELFHAKDGDNVGAGDVVRTDDGYGVCLGFAPRAGTFLIRYFDPKKPMHNGMTIRPVDEKDMKYLNLHCFFEFPDNVRLVHSYHNTFLSILEEEEKKRDVVAKAMAEATDSLEQMTFVDEKTGKRYKLVEI